MDTAPLPEKILLTGGSGLIGRALKRRLAEAGVRVVELAHRPRTGAHLWNAERGDPPPAAAFEGISAVVNLAGSNIATPWTQSAKRTIRDSRVNGTRALAEALSQLPQSKRPESFVSMSGTAIYGQKRDAVRLDESAPAAPAGESFLGDLAREWELVTGPAARAGIRTVCLRTGMVLDKRGGALAKMLPAFRLGLGGPVGDGRQRVAWIELDDLVSLIFFALRTKSLSGPVNAVSPHVVTNADFARALGETLHRSAKLRVPAGVVKFAFGSMGVETMLRDIAPFPAKALEAGFQFRYPELPAALDRALSES